MSVGLYGLPHRNGKIKLSACEKFDHEFFQVPEGEAAFMNPTERLIFEVTYETIIDAGNIF